MSKQIEKLFVMTKRLASVVEELKSEVSSMKADVNRAASNSEVFVSGYHEHGSEIAALQLKVDKLFAACPRMRLDTDEFKSVSGDEKNGGRDE